MKIKEDFFKKLDFKNIKELYQTDKNKFWFIEVDIIEHYLDQYDQSVKKFFYENLTFFQKKTILLEMELLTDYLNYLYKKSNYESFISFYDDYMKDFVENKEVKTLFFERFNELFRSINVFYRNQIRFINLIVDNYKKHKDKLALTFNIKDIDLRSIKLGCGDMHENGISTAILDLNGKKIMLKRGDNHTKLVINLYNEFLKENGLELVKLKSLEYEDFYYEEYLENTKITNIEKLMQSLGVLLFLAYLLGLTDLHYDNIMISENKLIPIDCETIFNIVEKREDGKYDLGESVFTSFLIPFRRINNCLLSGVSSEDRVFFENKDYELKIKESGLILSNSLSREKQRDNSSLQGNKLYKYIDVIVDSFKSSYLYFIYNSEKIIKEINNIILDKKIVSV